MGLAKQLWKWGQHRKDWVLRARPCIPKKIWNEICEQCLFMMCSVTCDKGMIFFAPSNIFQKKSERTAQKSKLKAEVREWVGFGGCAWRGMHNGSVWGKVGRVSDSGPANFREDDVSGMVTEGGCFEVAVRERAGDEGAACCGAGG